jgi:hypothetical protein
MCMPNTDLRSLGDGALLRTAQTSFDVRVESDVIALLRTIHINAIDPDVKNHLRDLIFAYRQSMSPADLEMVVTTFAPLGITILSDTNVAIKEKATVVLPPKKTSFISTSRPQPRFVSTVVSKPVVATAVEPIGVPSYNEDPIVVTPTPMSPVPQAVVQPVVPVLESVVPVEQKKETVVIDTPPIVDVSAPTYANPADRIKEIKHLVNERVGNPINLIDSHNEVGREYMNALLDAMKKSNGGQAQEVNEAMSRLEKAYTAVFEVIKQGPDATKVQPEVHQEPAVVRVPEPLMPKIATPLYEERLPADTTSNPVKIKIVQEPVALVPEAVMPTASVQAVEERAVPVVLTSRIASVAENLGTPIQQNPKVVENVPEPVATPLAQPHGNPSFHSVAEDKSLQDSIRIQREDISKQLQKEEAIKVSHMDPLETPEVTAGLGQLLSEWSLFKSSGIFGTGPSGKDHVLYLKLAPLTMSAVIAGRFEGVTPKIKQSIADYMNGWRYEEGVSHEHGETFEHYLRRVIYHILNKQKQVG